LRDEDWASEGSKRYYRRYIRKVIESASAITTISEYTKSELTRYFPEALDKTRAIHIAGNPIYRKTEPDVGVLKNYGLSEDRPFVLYVGQYQPRKNVAGMLGAFSRLAEDIRRDFEFVLAGSKMKQHMFLDIAKQADSLSDRIDVRMFVDVPEEDLLHLYNAASLFVFLPFYEGFGLPVLEAMRCGCPVLASSATSIPEVAGDAAVLVNPENTEEISAAMDRLLRDRELREDLAGRGLERASRFNWRRTASQTLEMYSELM
jgi:glycosyltransferase involved in cell wall biosynthesis